MRKRLIAVFIIFTIALTGVSAYDFILSPWQGGFGLNMASSKYDFSDKDIGYELQSSGSVDNTGARTKYTDAEIIGIVGVHGIDTQKFVGIFQPLENEYDPKGMTVTARCDGGFYFTSRSNPDAKRPFEIKLVLKRSSAGALGIVTETNYPVENFTLGRNSDSEIDNHDYPGLNADWKSHKYRNIWCDLVICLPFDSITSTGVLTADGRTYNLVEAADYSAVVTIEIEFDGETQSLTIPLSGYYSRNIDPSENTDTASLDVRTLPAAMNLNIGGTRRMERVADIDFMANQTRYYIDDGSLKTTQDSTQSSKYRIFLSASNAPNYSEGRGFELVHTSVNYSEPHTPYNSIGYTARLVNDETGGYMDFDGTDAIVGNNVPGLSATKRQVENQKHDIYYSEFHGGIEVLIDEITATGEQEGINKMLSGQYTSTIYVHVVGE